ncbi:MAG: hypothetical protein ACD_39C00972G0001 [uncultured bacterium]|nr:MAG: hypothetical protein ACD_39C00972G0001 [uncultured bacterium]
MTHACEQQRSRIWPYLKEFEDLGASRISGSIAGKYAECWVSGVKIGHLIANRAAYGIANPFVDSCRKQVTAAKIIDQILIIPVRLNAVAQKGNQVTAAHEIFREAFDQFGVEMTLIDQTYCRKTFKIGCFCFRCAA